MISKGEQDEMKMEKREQGRAIGGRKTESLGIDFIMKVCGGHAAPRIGVRQNRLPLPVDGNWVKKIVRYKL